MGYRLALRKFTLPQIAKPGSKFTYTSWWENLGVAPCYKDFKLALRLKGQGRTEVFVTDADIRTWLPGDSLFDGSFVVPEDLPSGIYEFDLALVDPADNEPKIQLAIEGRKSDGWYAVSEVEVQKELEPPVVEYDIQPPW
jgi:hypothetical protein